MSVTVQITTAAPSANPVFNVLPNSGDVYVEITQPSQIGGALVTVHWGDGAIQHMTTMLEPGTSFPAAVWKTPTFGHNYAAAGTYTITAEGDGVISGWYVDEFEVQQPLPTTTALITVKGLFRPPLAHRQRRDGTATAGPQLAHIGTTGGRPPLAWRQNSP